MRILCLPILLSGSILDLLWHRTSICLYAFLKIFQPHLLPTSQKLLHFFSLECSLFLKYNVANHLFSFPLICLRLLYIFLNVNINLANLSTAAVLVLYRSFTCHYKAGLDYLQQVKLTAYFDQLLDVGLRLRVWHLLDLLENRDKRTLSVVSETLIIHAAIFSVCALQVGSPVYDPPLSLTKSSTIKGRLAKSGLRTSSNTDGFQQKHAQLT